MSFAKEEIKIVESNLSHVYILHLDPYSSIGLAFCIGIISFFGIFIKGLFLYYVKCKAPKDRPINNMIFLDQVLII